MTEVKEKLRQDSDSSQQECVCKGYENQRNNNMSEENKFIKCKLFLSNDSFTYIHQSIFRSTYLSKRITIS